METKRKYKLKSCPFCGDSAMICGHLQSGYNEYFVKCTNCGARSNSYFTNPKKAVAEWNRRVDDNSRKCCICGKRINGYGNNPAPVKDEGVCCDRCNNTIVLAARIKACKTQKD